MSKERGQILTGYRQSSAAGTHVSRKPRTQKEAEELDFALRAWQDGDNRANQEASMTVFLFPSDPGIDDDIEWDEPSDRDLLDIEDEFDRPFDLGEYDDLFGDFDDDDRFPFDEYDEDDYDYDLDT